MRSYSATAPASESTHVVLIRGSTHKHVFVLEEVDFVFDKEPLAGVKVPPAYYVVPTKYHQVPPSTGRSRSIG